MGLILAIDQGTTSSRAILFDEEQSVVAVAQEEFTQHFPASGQVEHAPEDLWQTTVQTCRAAMEKAGIGASEITAIGITNQRETTLVWDRETGDPVYNAIVWQDRRTSDLCGDLKVRGLEPLFTERTGLLLDPYFSGTKVAWILDNVADARSRAEAGRLVFGTVDTWLIWKLTGGGVHVTDATNASRTLMYDIAKGGWDPELCGHLGVPLSMLPEVLDSNAEFGVSDASVFGAAIPILGVAGDQQAATLGQACFEPGMMKATYGTGCFALLNTGDDRVVSRNRLLTTIAYQLDGRPTYALEGSIFIAGAAVQWLRDGLGIIERADQSGSLAGEADPNQDVYMVPAFTGLGAPWWDAEARGAIYGLTRASGPREFARAALESVCYQTRDLLEAKRRDWQSGDGQTVLRVDGGVVASDWTMQCLADILAAPIDRPTILETTALGAAWLAGSKAGIWPGQEGFARTWALETRFEPKMDETLRERKYRGWLKAVRRTLESDALE
ncbi:MAG: glycerol kinase GlpK [Pseudomonadota bacterium]